MTTAPSQASGRRVLVGMSGGVDSSVASWLLKEQGWEVIGVTMKLWPQDCMSRAEDKCCGPQAIADARGVAHALGIPHYVVDEAVPFERLVIDYFTDEYRAGRTPNPCIMCNERVKFGNLRDKAAALGAEFIATGHYAIVEHHEGTPPVLRKGIDSRKDQSYFLFSLNASQLSRSLFPLGTLTKPEIRDIARKLGLKVADKEDSQEICFVPGKDYKAFLKGRFEERGESFQPGGFYDLHGNRLGDHDGIEFFILDIHKLAEILRGRAIGRYAHRNGLTNEANALRGERRIIGDLVARDGRARRDRQHTGHIVVKDNGVLESGRLFAFTNERVSNRTADKRDFKHSGDPDVSDELAAATEMSCVLLSENARADSFRGHLPLSLIPERQMQPKQSTTNIASRPDLLTIYVRYSGTRRGDIRLPGTTGWRCS